MDKKKKMFKCPYKKIYLDIFYLTHVSIISVNYNQWNQNQIIYNKINYVTTFFIFTIFIYNTIRKCVKYINKKPTIN